MKAIEARLVEDTLVAYESGTHACGRDFRREVASCLLVFLVHRMPARGEELEKAQTIVRETVGFTPTMGSIGGKLVKRTDYRPTSRSITHLALISTAEYLDRVLLAGASPVVALEYLESALKSRPVPLFNFDCILNCLTGVKQ